MASYQQFIRQMGSNLTRIYRHLQAVLAQSPKSSAGYSKILQEPLQGSVSANKPIENTAVFKEQDNHPDTVLNSDLPYQAYWKENGATTRLDKSLSPQLADKQ